MSGTSPIPSASGEVELLVTGMTCSGCVNVLTRALSRVVGVTNVEVDLDAGLARTAGTASPENLIAAVEKAGYGARLAANGETKG